MVSHTSNLLIYRRVFILSLGELNEVRYDLLWIHTPWQLMGVDVLCVNIAMCVELMQLATPIYKIITFYR